MTSDKTSFALFKSIIAKDVDAYEVRSTINFPGSQVLDSAGNLRTQKLKMA